MFLCLNANAAADKTPVVPGFALDRIQRPKRMLPLPDALRQRVAAGTANALTAGTGRFTRRDYEHGLPSHNAV
jgi:hypothetical protein